MKHVASESDCWQLWRSDGGRGEAIAPSGTCQKGGTLRSQKHFGLSFHVQKNGTENVQKIIPAYFFSLSQLKIESYFIQSV